MSLPDDSQLQDILEDNTSFNDLLTHHVPSFPFNFGEFQEVQELILIYFHDISSASSIQHSLTSSKDTAPISEHQSAT